ncbi:MAG TPA: SDR family NAD(P)-dependent oxidoreductase [Steroidobacteraceae bacterium]|jgi:NAD(P)-dependent dehydrogenase (short-subunit alcohol dehydrogenase family)|nr:SDR family NAD(P)-dependent oxidoreductase [Steroidobacteraceae bacterium]
MDLGLRGKRALVAGSSSGIGAGIARMLGTEQVEVVVHGRSMENAAAVARDIRHAGGKAWIVLGRLDQPEHVDRIAQDALAAAGQIDILINCAGAGKSTHSWFETPLERWHEQYQFSTLYAVQLIRALVPAMRERRWGRVLNVSTGASFKPSAFGPDYPAAKLALHSIAVSLMAELADSGVTVNTLTSGIVLTPNTLSVMQSRASRAGFTETGEALEKRVTRDLWQVPLGRAARIEELAAAACFLVSEHASYITGAALRVDGGASGFVV